MDVWTCETFTHPHTQKKTTHRKIKKNMQTEFTKQKYKTDKNSFKVSIM